MIHCKTVFLFVLMSMTLLAAVGQTQKVVADCTVRFSVSVGDSAQAPGVVKTSKTLYLKGYEVRTDIASPAFSQTTLFNGRQGSAVILREIGNAKYISTLDAAKWKAFNKRFEGSSVSLLDESKTILGYACKKAVVKLKDGAVFNMFYATEIIPSVSENPYEFQGIPGFVLEYETQSEPGKPKIQFTATEMNLSPVPSAKFEIPTSGYRIL